MRLGIYKFRDEKLLERALTHSSYRLQERMKNYEDYEVLELLGDAVINLVVIDIMIEDFGFRDEGIIVDYKSRIVSDRYLAELGKYIGLQDYIKVSKGVRVSDRIIADVVEAVFGAIYRDSGSIGKVKEEFRRLFLDKIKGDIGDRLKSYKVLLERESLRRFKERPEYRVIHEDKGEIHVECKVDRFSSVGVGKDKMEAIENASKLLYGIIEKLIFYR